MVTRRPVLAGALLMVLAAIPGQSQDAPARQMLLGERYVEGDTLVIPVEIDDLDGVLAGDIDLVFDDRVVTSISARATELLGGFLFLSNPVDGTLKIAFASAQARSGGSGALCEILVQPAEAEPALSFALVNLNDGEILVVYDPMTAVDDSMTLGRLKRRVREESDPSAGLSAD